MENRIKQLKKEISEQGDLNVFLYKSIPIATREYPLNENADEILKQWREGSTRIKELIRELNELEIVFNKNNKIQETEKHFVNGYGESTTREITTVSYNNSQKKLSKQVLSFIGNK